MNRPAFGKAGTSSPVTERPRTFKSLFSSDSRRHGRRRMMLPGKLWCGMRSATVDCLIGDASAGGARVRVKRGATVPSQLYLVHVRDRTAYKAQVVWRRADGSLGLKFSKSFNLDGAMAPELMAIRDYCLRQR